MTLDQRSIALLKKVVHATSYVSPYEIMEDLKVSKRTVYYDVDKINYWLKNNGLEEMSYIRSAGFYLSEDSKKRIKEKLGHLNKQQYEFSPKERTAWTAIFILSKETPVFLSDLMDKLNVSRSTLLADIKQLKEQLEHFKVELKFKKNTGYYFSGDEQNIRKVLVYFLSQVLTTRNWKEILSELPLTALQEQKLSPNRFMETGLEEIFSILSKAEAFIGVRFADEVIQTLSVHLFSFIKRLSQGQQVQMDRIEKEVIRETREYEASKLIAEKIENVFGIKVPEDEVYYIATYLLGAKVSDSPSSDVGNQDIFNLKVIIKHMVDDFQRYACVVFEKRADLERNLFIHLKPAYFRIKYGIDPENPLTESVKTKYSDIFNLTKKVVHHFEYVLGKPISADEIAYIAMHFGGWIVKEGVVVQSRKKALVVCSSGIGTSRILQKQIEELIPTIDVKKAITVREYENANLEGIDFVFSTVPIEDKGVSVYLVNPILTDTEKASLLNQIQSSGKPKTENVEALMDIIKKHAQIHHEQALYQELKDYFQIKHTAEREVRRKPMLNEILTKDKIQFEDKIENWQEAIRKAAQPLLADECITPEYIDAMIKNVDTLGPYIVIAPGIALPHARHEDGVKKIGMSFMRLKESCAFSEKPEHQVKLIFVLAAIDNETHLKALSQFSMMMSDATNVEKLQNASTVSEVLEVINQYSNL